MSDVSNTNFDLLFDLLQDTDHFARRHLGPDSTAIAAMLAQLGVDSLEQLMQQTVPASIRRQQPLQLDEGRSEYQVLQRLQQLAQKNQVFTSLIGMGYHDTITPAVIRRNILENPGWYTAYTPYQAEISQGRLEALLNYQQMVTDLTGMDLANASLLDESTAAAEAMAMSKRLCKAKTNNTFFVDQLVLPQTLAVIQTRAEFFGFDVVVGNPHTELEQHNCFGVLLQYPGCNGALSDPRDVIEQAHQQGALVTMAADLLSLALLTPPAELGADIVIGNSQRFGVPMGFGGPHAAFFAFKEAHKRSTPGRLIGVSKDSHDAPALRMAMQTREQHIRREKATSNICTSQSLLAIMAAMYAVYHGAEGITAIAQRVHGLAKQLAAGLAESGCKLVNQSFFDTVTIEVGAQQTDILARAEQQQINLRPIGTDQIGISLNEKSDLAQICQVWSLITGHNADQFVAADATSGAIPASLQRQSPFLTHPVFKRYHSETEMMRYLKRLENRDIALTRSMIPLGSCTMKLNSAVELTPVTWPQFSDLHPFAPLAQSEGYREMITELEQMLVECTGYDAVSLQPNAGSQGEYAGLLAIQRYHQHRGDDQRNICLIPSSAHGTNPASAQMAGMKVVVVRCDSDGNVDLDDLRSKAEQHQQDLSAIMITYPSTHGVFEEQVVDICDIVHQYGGQVYLDGANLNALVGLAAPGKFGADVSHLNLHKTFAIPHGGGGPGVGPVAVRAHLADYLPTHPVQAPHANLATDAPTISAAPWGSAGILPISWSYIALMGGRGLQLATEVAILNANYIAERLKAHYPILYTGHQGRVAHECIIDLNPFKEQAGISAEDVAKRLIDFGFHAPTMSFPVAGTLMIEPTESESKEELDRFCDAMIAIRKEIQQVALGELDAEDNPLKHAPHTAAHLSQEPWPHSYSRHQALFPLPYLLQDKYWPPVGRIDNVYGDRNLICSCPTMADYE